ncbi:hypothetical protein [Actinokineospora globicatena]|uniref:PknH-like extracellular domain-containing protein n=1 Tax=Actinokineospora globicatena TaxID=103729 RepID=A0A9W6QL43_9PSEU|nr:hypothetical protein [Actinokineospora globicatena]GLW91635.1 hypothetical protein Aglo03_24510 [Actinokineospora globicatena]
MSTTRIGSLVLAAWLLAVVASCSTDQGGQPAAPEPDLGVVKPAEHNSDIVFPLDAYKLTPEQVVALKRADDIVVHRCMKRFGFDAPMPVRTPRPDEGRTIGVIEEAEAAQYGYKDPKAMEAAREVTAAKAAETSWPAEMMGVLNGEGQSKVAGVDVPEGGCNGEGRRALGRPDNTSQAPGDVNFVIGLTSRSSVLAEADGRLKEVFGKWSGCMAEAGYSYRDPWGPNDDPKFGSDVATPEEIATAKTDVFCRKRFNVNGIWVAVRSAHQRQLIEGNAEALRQHQERVDEQLRKAAQVVAGG